MNSYILLVNNSSRHELEVANVLGSSPSAAELKCVPHFQLGIDLCGETAPRFPGGSHYSYFLQSSAVSHGITGGEGAAHLTPFSAAHVRGTSLCALEGQIHKTLNITPGDAGPENKIGVPWRCIFPDA